MHTRYRALNSNMENISTEDEGGNSWGGGELAILKRMVRASLPEKVTCEPTDDGSLQRTVLRRGNENSSSLGQRMPA